jgi:peptidoglycan hydrolase-like protein with peptidoglycan-binding domain
MRVSLLAAIAALTLAAPAAAQTSTDLNMPIAPAGLGERITAGTQTPFQPAYNPAGFQVAPSQLSAAQVRQLQQGLRAQGYPLRRVDGRFGPETAGALQSFQQRQNIASPPGQVDVRALGMLGVGVPAAPYRGATASSGLSIPLEGSVTRRR